MKVKVTISNADATVLNKIRHLNLRDVRIAENEITLTAPLVRQRALKQILRNYDAHVERIPGVLDIPAFFHARVFLVACLFVAICSLTVLSNFIFRVEIRGLDPAQTAEVSTFLHNTGVRPLTTRATHRGANFSAALINEFPFIAHASHEIRGTRLVVHVYPAVNPPQSGDTDLITRWNAIITDIIVIGGTKVAEAGQHVTAGEILVRAARQVGDIETGETDEMGRPIFTPVYEPTRAVALVQGRVLASATTTITDPTQVLLTQLHLVSNLQQSHRGVTFVYSQFDHHTAPDGTITVTVSLSSAVMNIL